jgi:hypothetical protein
MRHIALRARPSSNCCANSSTAEQHPLQQILSHAQAAALELSKKVIYAAVLYSTSKESRAMNGYAMHARRTLPGSGVRGRQSEKSSPSVMATLNAEIS